MTGHTSRGLDLGLVALVRSVSSPCWRRCAVNQFRKIA